MRLTTPRASSVTEQGEPDGFEIPSAWSSEADPAGQTRLVVSVPTAQLAMVHRALIGALEAPIGLLYRQKVDRASPRPAGAPHRDFVRLDLNHDALLAAVNASYNLVYHDARGELWLRGRFQDQVVLDEDGVLYCYPDDPAFRDVLRSIGVPERATPTMATRDYVKHWFHAQCDAEESAFIDALRLVEVSPQ